MDEALITPLGKRHLQQYKIPQVNRGLCLHTYLITRMSFYTRVCASCTGFPVHRIFEMAAKYVQIMCLVKKEGIIIFI